MQASGWRGWAWGGAHRRVVGGRCNRGAAARAPASPPSPGLPPFPPPSHRRRAAPPTNSWCGPGGSSARLGGWGLQGRGVLLHARVVRHVAHTCLPAAAPAWPATQVPTPTGNPSVDLPVYRRAAFNESGCVSGISVSLALRGDGSEGRAPP